MTQQVITMPFTCHLCIGLPSCLFLKTHRTFHPSKIYRYHWFYNFNLHQALFSEQWQFIQGDQKVSLLLMITIQSSGSQRLFDHSVFLNSVSYTCENNEYFCFTTGRAVACQVGEWQPWSPCSVSCGIGESTRTRQVLKHSRRGSRRCPSLAETKWCGEHTECPQRFFNW